MPSQADYEEVYNELLGYTPVQIAKRIEIGLEVDPLLTERFETLRKAVMYPEALDSKSVQIILFGQLLSHLANSAEYHALAARRLGATREELHAVVGLSLLVRGMQAFNLGGEILSKVFPRSDGSDSQAD